MDAHPPIRSISPLLARFPWYSHKICTSNDLSEGEDGTEFQVNYFSPSCFLLNDFLDFYRIFASIRSSSLPSYSSEGSCHEAAKQFGRHL